MKQAPHPRRQLGLFDATMIVMGGIVGAGIFANPSEVAHRVHTPFFILRRRHIGSETAALTPGHPFTTMLFVLSCAGIVVSAIIASPRNSAIALGIMLAALPVYYFWRTFKRA